MSVACRGRLMADCDRARRGPWTAPELRTLRFRSVFGVLSPITRGRAHGPYDIADLDIYFEHCVIGGPGAFIVTVDDISQFPAAIRRKLVLEIAGIAPEARFMPAALVNQRVDCLIGERKLERFLSSFPR